jgi:glucose-6-phosphate isomerase
MESLGKEKDRDPNIVHQGLTVYGNKGYTDQHSFIQQLRDGLKKFSSQLLRFFEPKMIHRLKLILA